MKYPDHYINKLIHGDCLDVMKGIPDESINLIVTDPPYGVGKDKWDNKYLSKDILQELVRVLKSNGSLYLFGSIWWYPIQHVKLIELGMIPRNIIAWFYNNGMSRLKYNYVIQYDPIGFFTKSDEYTFNTDAIRVPYESERVKNPVYKKGRAWYPNPLGKKRTNVFRIPTLAGKNYQKEKVDHPTQKPVDVITPPILASSNENDIVLDPFIGSGTIAIACINTNRNFIGIEKEKKYVEIANERISKYSV
ncbi:MAG: DNA-methyltransferase [Candidatus Hodarchaeales archaeon]|jgi:site-specific DNA-methyltransferase (adenine-specific)